MQKYKFEHLRGIPIMRVAETLGMSLRKTGYLTWNMRDPEDPRDNSSLTIFEKTNSWHRFSGINHGGVHGGSTIDLVIHIRECTLQEACDFLLTYFPDVER